MVLCKLLHHSAQSPYTGGSTIIARIKNMITLLLLIVAGGLFVYVAQGNLEPVSLIIGPYTLVDLPLFYVIMGSLLIGLMLAYVLHLGQAISNSWELRTKKKEIERTKDEVMELTKRVHQLELENQKLKLGASDESDEPVDMQSL